MSDLLRNRVRKLIARCKRRDAFGAPYTVRKLEKSLDTHIRNPHMYNIGRSCEKSKLTILVLKTVASYISFINIIRSCEFSRLGNVSSRLP